MWSKLRIYIVLAFLINLRFVEAQQVLYSPSINDRATLNFIIAGKTGGFYWVQKEKRKRSALKKSEWPLNVEQSFDIYDEHMNLVNTVASYNISDSTLKEFLVPGDVHFDELILSAAKQETQLILKRYSRQGDTVISNRLIATMPFVEQGNCFLLVRSEDRQKILLLGFESVPSSPPRLHAILFDASWNQLYASVYEHPSFSQPFIQDDFITNPIEHFNGAPVQVANNGQWLMACPSRTSYNFLLFHFRGTDSGMSSRDIILPPSYSMEDVALYIDNEKEEAFAGILSGFRHNTHKNVHITHYSMQAQQFDFDSSYRFNTLPVGKMKNENITKEVFMAVPGKGFVLLKEYGRNFEGWYENEYFDNNWDPDVLFANHDASNQQVIFSNSQDGYTRYNSLNGIRGNFNRGDLNLFYFPAHSQDSCWSGIVSKEQTTELNAPALSYLMMPVKNRLFLLYNSFLRNNDQYGSSTILDARGNLQNNEGVIYWKFNTTLSFQQSIQISENEVAVPYDKNQRRGFAVIRF